jgi:iron complex outermembrane receptor protein
VATAVSACCLALSGNPARAEKDAASLEVRVVHMATRAPVAGALGIVEENAREARSGADGTMTLTGLAPGTYHLVVTASGFTPARVEVTVGAEGVTTAPDVVLTPELHYSEIVSVSPTARDQFESYQATSVLAGQDLAIEMGNTLADTVSAQPGIAERSLGPGSSRPVIRGFDGDRVMVLEDGQRMGDLSSQSGDHGVNVNPAAASRIEVVRGPATLLYGSNAIGGLVNVITDLVPAEPVQKATGTLQADFGTGAREAGAAADIVVGNGQWALRAGGAGRRSGDVHTPDGTVDNTQSRSGLGSIGVSRTSPSGHFGGSYQYDDFKYGVPVIEEGTVQLTPRRHAVSLEGERRNLGGFFSTVEGSLNYRNYRHDELEATDVGTQFKNRTTDFDVMSHHRATGRLTGTIGGWGMTRAFEAIGEEALSPPVDQNGFAVFAYEELTWPHATVQFGARYEHAAFSPEGGLRPRSFDNVSGSVGLLVRPTEATTIAVSIARAVRNPALEELYFFGPHPGNFSFEIGNPDLDAEKGLGVDVAFRWRQPRFSGEISYFRNDIADYIFRNPISEEEFDAKYGHEAHAGDDEDGHGHGEDLQLVEFVGADSVLQGLEFHGDVHITQPLIAEVTFDTVRGELKDTGDALPRIPPMRLLAGLRYQKDAFQGGGQVVWAADQDRVFGEETPTDGYALLKLFASYSIQAGGAVHTVTARLDNVTNERYRNHLSFVKDEVAEMGRDFRVVYSVRF